MDSVEKQLEVQKIFHDTLDPIGRPLETYYLFDRGRANAYIELAKASGYECLELSERNPMNTSTIGTGLQILHAVNRGAKQIFVGLGGSAVNDGGIGMASVLGYSFLSENNDTILPLGKNLIEIQSIAGYFKFPDVKVFAVNDVDNPLYGPEGAAYTYGPQKGANADEVKYLDHGLRNLNEQSKIHLNKDYSQIPGAGAAGGSAYGLKTFCDAQFIGGVEFLFQISKLDQLMKSVNFDLIITGEGCIDQQSLKGKLINGLIKRSYAYPAKVVAICGKLELDKSEWRAMGLDYVTPIAQGVSKFESLRNAAFFTEEIVPQLFKNL